jgi:hypothetical protein
MASYSGFIRKSPTHRLKVFFESRQVRAPDDFDWTSEGRGTALVKSIEDVLGELTDLQQDAVKVELDRLASLADGNGFLGIEQVSAGAGIDLDGYEGIQDMLLMLSIEHPNLMERVTAQTSLLRRSGGKYWSAFQFPDDGTIWVMDDPIARQSFLSDAVDILELPKHRKREADWYKTVRTHPITGKETEILQATIYVEERAESELAFGIEDTLERQLVQKVLEVGMAWDPDQRIVEICSKGGKQTRDKYARAFASRFAPHAPDPVETPRREVRLTRLNSPSLFEIEPADGVESVEVSALEFYSEGGGFARFERRGNAENIYQYLERQFGDASPLNASGWHIVSATLRIVLAAPDGGRRKTLTITLKSPNTTTLQNKTEEDRQFVLRLLDRWKLFAPLEDDIDIIEAA